MIWLHPATALGLLAVVAPVLIHFFVHRAGPRVSFPTIRFIRATRLASVRRRVIEDAPLLAVRVSIFAAAAAALAGPFLVTPSRRREWDARTVRAVVADDSLSEGITRAIARLDRQPPGRREIVIRSPLTLGSIAAADLSRVPPAVGISFERTSALPPTLTIAGAPVLFAPPGGADLHEDLSEVQREITLNGDRSSVRDVAIVAGGKPPIEIVAPDDQRRADEALEAILADRAPVPSPGHSARVVLTERGVNDAIRTPWMADAAARIWRDASRDRVLAEKLRLGSLGSSSGTLVVTIEARASDPIVLTLVRAVLNSLAPQPDRTREEIVPIPDAELAAWSRAPGPAEPPRPEAIPRDDRRWLWALALGLLGVEAWIRRSRSPSASTTDDSSFAEQSRVA